MIKRLPRARAKPNTKGQGQNLGQKLGQGQGQGQGQNHKLLFILLALSVSIELVSSSARVTSVKSQQGVVRTDGHPDTKIGPGTPGSDKNSQSLEDTQVGYILQKYTLAQKS